MKLTESEKNRIRGLHKQNSIIKEDKDWGGNKDEYKRRDGHKLGDEGGHYKTYEGDTTFDEAGDITMDEFWGAGADEYKRRDGHRTGDLDGHYKDYETNEAGDVIGVDRPESKEAQTRYDGFSNEGDTTFDEDKDFDVTEADIALTEDTEGEETYHYGEDEGEDHDEEMDLEHDEDMAPHDRIDAIEKHLDALRKDMSYDEGHEDRDEEGDDFE